MPAIFAFIISNLLFLVIDLNSLICPPKLAWLNFGQEPALQLLLILFEICQLAVFVYFLGGVSHKNMKNWGRNKVCDLIS